MGISRELNDQSQPFSLKDWIVRTSNTLAGQKAAFLELAAEVRQQRQLPPSSVVAGFLVAIYSALGCRVWTAREAIWSCRASAGPPWTCLRLVLGQFLDLDSENAPVKLGLFLRDAVGQVAYGLTVTEVGMDHGVKLWTVSPVRAGVARQPHP
jgi:hypothetical protein